MVNCCILTGYGINADRELADAFVRAGAETASIHVQDLIENARLLDSFHILAFPGGFSFGDHLGSGKVLANLFRRNLKEDLDRFVASGKAVIGICNGFQALVKMGLLPNLAGNWEQEVSLVHNDHGLFEDRWVPLVFPSDSNSLWTKGLKETELPIRNGEGRFVVRSGDISRGLRDKGLVAVQYRKNPNGSLEDIAGISDPSGRILGLMPHPEAFIRAEEHPSWNQREPSPHEPSGLSLIKNGVLYAADRFGV
ncbi:MAG: phosphoribosylformylglycinamidine synthase subunit PurQ [Spirochaetales bacterium]|nr:phosphoribosylformylglycinamidine synthase subunit PurQ [Spirochaetales bacterium]MCF7938615.1 phosphoribosylformylglycinamidine synthase subunit PurQ [Spirochaetales bacterium]